VPGCREACSLGEGRGYLQDIHLILKVRALKDFWNLHDPTALNVRAGDVITVRGPCRHSFENMKLLL
jgi:hypothetical protein